MEPIKEVFETRDFSFAACLMVETIRYIEARRDTENSRRLIFVFEGSPEIPRIQAERANGTHVVSSVAYDDCLRKLKTIIHNCP